MPAGLEHGALAAHGLQREVILCTERLPFATTRLLPGAPRTKNPLSRGAKGAAGGKSASPEC